MITRRQVIFFLKTLFVVNVLLYVFVFYPFTTPVGFLVLGYCLTAILFVVDSRISAFLALVCLALCPPLLYFKNDLLAEKMAIRAYYFLVITVITQILETRNPDYKSNLTRFLDYFLEGKIFKLNLSTKSCVSNSQLESETKSKIFEPKKLNKNS